MRRVNGAGQRLITMTPPRLVCECVPVKAWVVEAWVVEGLVAGRVVPVNRAAESAPSS